MRIAAVLRGMPDAGKPRARPCGREAAPAKPWRAASPCGKTAGLARLLLAAALCAAAAVSTAAEVAVLFNGAGRHRNEFDTAFSELGWTSQAFDDTPASMEAFGKEIDRFEFVLMAPLFGYDTPPDFDVAPLRRWVEAGGVFVVTDGSYAVPRGVVEKIDGRLGGLQTGKCTSSQWSVNGYTANEKPAHMMRAFPNALTDGDSWPHFEEPPAESPWKVLTRCSEGKPVILFAEVGKGAVMLSALRQQASKALENYYAYSQLRKSGLSVRRFSLSELRPGRGSMGVELAAPPPPGAKIVYELTDAKGGRQTFAASFDGLAATNDFDVAFRGEVLVELRVEHGGARRVVSSRRATLPALFEVGPNAYRGILSTKRRAGEVRFPARFAPAGEDLSSATLSFAVFDELGTGKVASAEFHLPTSGVPAEIWFPVPLDPKLAAGAYRLDATLEKGGGPGAKPVLEKASAPFEILEPRLAQCVIDEDGTFLVNGKPFFPLGIYHAPPSSYETLKEIGFNTIQFWAWHGVSDPYGVPTAMHRAMGNGLRCLFEANHRNETIYREQADRYADNPAMLMWYLADEPDEGQAKELRDHNAWRHGFDKHHPTYIVSCRPDLFSFHASFADVFAMDPYGDNAKVIEWCRRAEREIAPHKPVVVVPWADRDDPGEIPLQAWTAIVHGARGLIWYCWSQAGGGPLGTGIGRQPGKQTVYKKLLAEIGEALPGLTSTVRRTFEAGDVHGIACGSGGGRRYLVILNTNEEKPVDVDLPLPELRGVERVYLPQRKVPRKDGSGNVVKNGDGVVQTTDDTLDIRPGAFVGTLAPREVRIWRY